MLNFGDKVRDRVTGFEGIIVGMSQYFNGCKKYGLQGTKLKDDGTTTDWEWFDVQQCELVEAGAVDIDEIDDVGGPMPTP